MPNHVSRLAVFCLAVALGAATTVSAQVLTSIYSFDNATNDFNLTAGLLLSGDTLYGTAAGGTLPDGGRSAEPVSGGAVFKLNTDGTGFTNLYIFSSASGSPADPYVTNTDGANLAYAPQLVLSGNRLYGTTDRGGFNADGTIFSIKTDGTGFTNLHNFSANLASNSDGAIPCSGMVLSGNTLYGLTAAGGRSGQGTAFAINTDGTGFTNLYSFNSTNGNAGGPKSIILSGNAFYGTTAYDGISGNGTVFFLKTDGTGFTNLHVFSGLVRMTTAPYLFTNSDGANPIAGLVLARGKLYGTASKGGYESNGYAIGAGGTVFALKTDGTGFTNLHSFNGSDGEVPNAALFLSGDTLYGTTADGGSLTSQQNGTVFAINTDGTGFATLHTFTPRVYVSASAVATNADGSASFASMVLSGSTLFGTTRDGGTNGYGTVFALDLTAAPPTIQFTASPTNAAPPATVQYNAPTVDASGNAILSWNWNFGDTSNSILQNPSHAYTNTGTFFPALTCVNSDGSTVTGFGPAITVAYPRSILNGGFETGTFTDWTQSGGFFSSGVATGAAYAHSGTYGAALLTGGAMGFISQTLTTTPGAVYTISFWLNNPRKFVNTNDFQVSWNGNLLLDESDIAAIGWTNIQLTATATSAISTLQFGYLNGNYYFSLDDISVTSGGPAQPQPQIASFSVTGTNLTLSGGGASPSQTILVLMSTNLLQPLSQWTPISTNASDSSGKFDFTATNAAYPNASQRFYILQLH
jgi:uncharacterized repeat protein (TIGR03803 family)